MNVILKWEQTYICPPDCGGEDHDEYGFIPYCPQCKRELEGYTICRDLFCCRCGVKLNWEIFDSLLDYSEVYRNKLSYIEDKLKQETNTNLLLKKEKLDTLISEFLKEKIILEETISKINEIKDVVNNLIEK